MFSYVVKSNFLESGLPYHEGIRNEVIYTNHDVPEDLAIKNVIRVSNSSYVE